MFRAEPALESSEKKKKSDLDGQATKYVPLTGEGFIFIFFHGKLKQWELCHSGAATATEISPTL